MINTAGVQYDKVRDVDAAPCLYKRIHLSWRKLKLIDLQIRFGNGITKNYSVQLFLIPVIISSLLEARVFVGHRINSLRCPRTVAVI